MACASERRPNFGEIPIQPKVVLRRAAIDLKTHAAHLASRALEKRHAPDRRARDRPSAACADSGARRHNRNVLQTQTQWKKHGGRLSGTTLQESSRRHWQRARAQPVR